MTASGDRDLVARAVGGDTAALEEVVKSLRDPLYRLALRMVWRPADAEDATQEILIRVITRLASWRGEAALLTWAYRIGVNYLLNLRRQTPPEAANISFDEFRDGLADGLAAADYAGPEAELLVHEMRLTCTQAMLQCLSRNERVTYVLGDIFELPSDEAAWICDVTPAAYRKRLERVRQRIRAFMNSTCGLVNPDAFCRCARRIEKAKSLNRLDPERPVLAAHPITAAGKDVEAAAEQIGRLRDAAAVLRAHPDYAAPRDRTNAITTLLRSGRFPLLDALRCRAAEATALPLRVVEKRADWDVAVIGGGPAGLAAARAAAAAGARTVVLERAEHPRYKTCGGGLMGASLTAAGLEDLPSRDTITSVTFTLHGKRRYTRRHDTPLLEMVVRDEFDDALRRRAEAAGATVRQQTTVRGIDQGDGYATVRLSGGDSLTAASVIGADGSAGITARHVGVEFAQTDLGLEQEIDVPDAVAGTWRGRVLLDWGSYPGSYAWVFPKGSRLTVGVIASRGEGEWTKRYLREFVAQVKLESYPVARDSGHLTRCRADSSPLRSGRVIVAGDAAGLLEPWTREGISFALRSGGFAGEAAAKAASAESPAAAEASLEEYVANVNRVLVPEMAAGRLLLSAFSKHTGMFHTGLATPKGQRLFGRICRSEITYAEIVAKPAARRVLSLLSRR